MSPLGHLGSKPVSSPRISREGASPSWVRALPCLLAAAGALGLSAGRLRAQDEGPAARLDRAEVAARGTQSAIVTVTRFGRYAITVKSPQGTSLQLVSRMGGPGDESGAAGERDGRLDVLLERGDYKVVARSHTRGTGTAALAVHPFEELSPEPRRLVELKPLETTLGDFQQRSYWIEIPKGRRVTLEAAGRHLTDLRLWRDGTWVVAAEPDRHVVQPRPGQPLTVLQLSPQLEPGLYLLTAYGGPSLPWSDDDGRQPLHIRFGIPGLAEAGRRRMTVSPFGTDRYRVAGGASFFRIELPEARPASLRVGTYDAARPFVEGDHVAEVVKESLPPVAELQVPRRENGEHIVTVTAEAGQPYVLQHFDLRSVYTFEGGGDYWLSSIHSGHPEDSVDATGIVVGGPPQRHATPLASQTVQLDPESSWTRRANLLGTLTVFLEVKTAGTYEVVMEGVDARARVEPFLVSRPPHYRPPALRESGATWDLDAGFHVLTVEPVQKGIVRLTVRAKGLLDRALEVVGIERSVPEEPVRGAVRFLRLSLDPRWTYTAYLNEQPGVKAGLVLRKLPIDLRDPLPLLQRPGEDVTVPVRCPEAGVIRATAEDGSLLDVSLDGAAWTQGAPAGSGPHKVRVSVRGSSPVSYSLSLSPTRLLPSSPLPALPDSALASLPEFPVIDERSPKFFDLTQGQSATFNLRADEPALYRLESTGLLATSGHLRTRTITTFASARQNGTGRNFSVDGYLGIGDYQATVRTEGRSAGHLGLVLSRTDPIHAGYITSGIPARMSVDAGQSVVYRFIITNPGRFRVRALALDRQLRWRLEDSEGWPIVAPGESSDVTRDFPPGHYRVILLPETTPARVITRIDPVQGPRQYSGHGPHTLPLARRVEHEWREPAGAEPRLPDAWGFALPADVDATIELTGEMQADLVRLDEDESEEKVAFVPPGRGWRGPLTRGHYRLDAVASRKNNRLTYQVAVWVDQLVAGLTREVTPPVVVPVSVGETGLVELTSFGGIDVKARLTDDEGRAVASNDDRLDDWNFAIAEALTPGSYTLAVDPVGGAQGTCEISMHVPRETEEPPLALPATEEIRLGSGPQVYPLALPPEGDLLLVSARSRESVGVAVEVLDAGTWRPVGSASGRTAALELLLPRPRPGASAHETLRLRLWSLDRRDTVVGLSVLTASVPRVTERALASGAPLVDLPSDAAAAVAVTLDGPGLFRVPEETRLRWCAAPLQPCGSARRQIVTATSDRIVAVGETGDEARATRLRLETGRPVVVALDGATTLTSDLRSETAGPVVVVASAREGQPGVRLLRRGATALEGPTVMAVGSRSALALQLQPGDLVASVWAASPPQAAFDTRIEARAFPAPSPFEVDLGVREGEIEGHAAQTLRLRKEAKRLRIGLDAGLAVALETDGHLEAAIWAEELPVAETVETVADRMTILNLGGESARYALEILPLGAETPTPPLAAGSPLERMSLRTGTARIRVAAGPPARLHVRGEVNDVVFVSDAGVVSRGTDLALDGHGGTLRVAHGVGPLLCWIDRPGAEAQDLWGRGRDARAHPLELPAMLELQGDVQLLRLEPTRPVLLQLRSAAPLVSLLQRPRGEPRVEVHPQGATLDAFLPPGETQLLLRAFAGQRLTGTAELTATPVTAVEEGVGPETLLAPGRTKLFSFTVERPGPVGIGVRASADVVEAILMSEDGEPIGRGPVLMPTLDPGPYLLALTCPANAEPVRARPALVGLVPPGSGPPPDVIRRYLEQEPFEPPDGDGPPEGAVDSFDDGSREEGGEE